MGAWGTGLYSSDMAADMRAVIKSALRLPFDEDRIVDILRDGERRAADDPGNEDHTTFWLVLADQLEKRGVAHAPTREKAIAIIDRGDDLMMMERLGMKPADLRKRGAKLAELRARLAAAPLLSKPRATILAPQNYTLEIGLLYACPVKGSNCINPYRGKTNFDGSPWIRNQVRRQSLPLDDLGLDFYHLSENVHKARREPYGEEYVRREGEQEAERQIPVTPGPDAVRQGEAQHRQREDVAPEAGRLWSEV